MTLLITLLISGTRFIVPHILTGDTPSRELESVLSGERERERELLAI